MEKLSQTPETYDRMFAEGGYGGTFRLHYKHTWYYPLYRKVLSIVQRHGGRHVLEVGCGTGGFAHLLQETTALEYAGFDFSSEAVSQARARTGREDCFSVGDATIPESYPGTYDTIVCTEVLEHIEPDREVISLWKPGTRCVCSVPNFDSTVHVRHFLSEDDVLKRYGDLLDIDSIERLKKPQLPDISLRNRLRHLRWNRYRPGRLLGLLGLAPFSDGGWFVFSGRKR